MTETEILSIYISAELEKNGVRRESVRRGQYNIQPTNEWIDDRCRIGRMLGADWMQEESSDIRSKDGQSVLKTS